eukprot:tig00000523_g1860.t1
MLSAAVRMLLSFDASKSALLANQLSHAAEALSPYFRRDPAALGPVMDRLQLFQWMAPGEAVVRAAAGGDAAGAEAQEADAPSALPFLARLTSAPAQTCYGGRCGCDPVRGYFSLVCDSAAVDGPVCCPSGGARAPATSARRPDS